MITKQQMDQAANDSTLSQKIQLMIWEYMKLGMEKRDLSKLAQEIINLVRESK